TKDATRQEVKKDVSSLRYIALHNWVHDALLESTSNHAQDTCKADAPESSENPNPTASTTNPQAEPIETLAVETPIPTVDSDGVEANVSNMETTITASPTPTLRIHKDHLKSQIISPVDTPIQTRHKSKEVLKNKKDERGIVIRNEARLVAQGHTQEEGIDYDEVFALVARIEAIRLFLAYASFMGFIVYQMDVKSAFLYCTIDEEVYLMQPPGFQDLEFPTRVYKVEKAMYGLHQAPRAWYGTLSKYLLTNGFQRGTIDQTLIIRRQRGEFILVQVYVDDIIFGSSNPQLCREFGALMYEKFQMSVMGLWYPKESPFDLVAYSDSDYGGASQDRKSTTRGCQFLGRRLISWQCKKQTIVATLTTEAEYVAAANLLTKPFDAWRSQYLVGEGLGTLTESHHTPTSEASQSSQHELPSPSLPPVTTATIPTVIPTSPLPTVIPTDTTPLRHYTRRARIAYDSTPRVTSLAADKGSMQQKLDELTDLCTSLQRQQSEIISKFALQELEINRLKARIKLLEDKDRGVAEHSGDDAPIKGRILDEGEEAAERVSDDTEEMATVLTSMDATSILTSGGVQVVPTATVSIPTGSGVVSIASLIIPTAALIFTTATESTPYIRRKGKKKMVESDTPKKKNLQEQIDIPEDLSIKERIELISDLVKYQENYAQVHKYQTLQRKPRSKKQKKDYYMAVIKGHAGWKTKDFKGMSFEQIEAKFNTVWKQIKDFIPMGSKEEAKRFKRKGLRLEQESAKKLKTSEEVPEKVKSSEEVPEEKVKEMMQLVPVEEVFVEALQVKHPIIDWKVHTEGQRSYWKITRPRYFHADREGLSSEEGSGDSYDMLQTSSGELLLDGK
nr:putative ribonuclease H-like domain-containing protein [Tanacetum cinerariifolium]